MIDEDGNEEDDCPCWSCGMPTQVSDKEQKWLLVIKRTCWCSDCEESYISYRFGRL
jgi:hypothetical protein